MMEITGLSLGKNARTNNGSCRFGTKMSPPPPPSPFLLPLTVCPSSLCPRPLCVLRRLGRESARGGDGNEKEQKRGSRLFCLPIFHRFLIHFIFIFFEYPAGVTAKERAFFSVSCIMQICCCRSFYRPQSANQCISLFSCFVCVSVFASVC